MDIVLSTVHSIHDVCHNAWVSAAALQNVDVTRVGPDLTDSTINGLQIEMLDVTWVGPDLTDNTMNGLQIEMICKQMFGL